MRNINIEIANRENRIALLSERNKDNGRIVAKLRRELRALEAKLAATGSEVQ